MQMGSVTFAPRPSAPTCCAPRRPAATPPQPHPQTPRRTAALGWTRIGGPRPGPGGLATGAKISAFSPPPRTHSRTPSSAASPATHTRPTNPLSLSLFCCRAAGKDGPLRDLLGDERHAEVLVGCLALFLYWNTMLAGFVYDDR